MTTSQKKILNRLLTIAIAALLLLLAAVLFLRREKPADPVEEEIPSGDVSTPPEPLPPTPPEPDPEAAVSFAALTYSTGDTTLAFTKGEDDRWSWDGDREFPLDPACIQRIMTALSPLEIRETVEAPGEPAAYGLDEVSVYLTAVYTDGTELRLEFGDRLPDSADRYLRRSDAPGAVYVAPETLPVLMDTAIYDMMVLPKLPVPEISAITSITLRGTEETILSAMEQEGGDGQNAAAAPVWLEGERDVSSNQRVQALTAALTGLELTRCENFKPSDGAITYWDLDAPAVTLEILCGTERRLTLEIGARTLTGDARYVRYNDDVNVYSMSETALAPIMTVAAFGLEIQTVDDGAGTADAETPEE